MKTDMDVLGVEQLAFDLGIEPVSGVSWFKQHMANPDIGFEDNDKGVRFRCQTCWSTHTKYAFHRGGAGDSEKGGPCYTLWLAQPYMADDGQGELEDLPDHLDVRCVLCGAEWVGSTHGVEPPVEDGDEDDD